MKYYEKNELIKERWGSGVLVPLLRDVNLNINYVFSFLLSFLLLFQIVLVYYFPFFQVLEIWNSTWWL